MTRSLLVATLFAATLGSGPRAHAEEPERRPVPDYDGRGDEPVTAGEVLLWVPRVVFFPLYLVSEYLLRQPLGWLITTAEENHWPLLVLEAFLFGEG